MHYVLKNHPTGTESDEVTELTDGTRTTHHWCLEKCENTHFAHLLNVYGEYSKKMWGTQQENIHTITQDHHLWLQPKW